jgi:nucleoside-diphosphate-sugar epimerase
LITGGAGFIGHNTALMALEMGHEVHILDNLSTGLQSNADLVVNNGGKFHFADIRNNQQLEDYMVNVDAVIHLAAQVSVPLSIDNPEKNWEINVNGTENVLSIAKKLGTPRVIVASSAAVYGMCSEMPLKESSAGDLLSPYAESKMENENQVAKYREQGLEAIAFRFFNVYGPRQDSNGAYAAVISKFISLLHQRKAPTIFGDGGQTRDFIHVEDVSRILLESLSMDWNPGLNLVYNVATQTEISLIDLLETLYEILKEKEVDVMSLQPNFAEERKGDIRHSFASIESTTSDFSWSPKVNLYDGLKQLVNENGE